MIFHITPHKSKHKKIMADVEIPIGNLVCGLQYEGCRPQSVTLTHKELVYLIENPKYTLQCILPSFARKTEDEQASKEMEPHDV